MSPTIAEFIVGVLVAVLAFYWGVKVAPVLLRSLQAWLKQSKQEAESLDATPPKVIEGEVTHKSSTEGKNTR